MMDGFDMGSGGWIAMILFWTVLVLVVVWAVSQLRPAAPAERPLEILDRRLARGEIDTATYEQLRAKLTGSAPARPPDPSATSRSPQ